MCTTRRDFEERKRRGEERKGRKKRSMGGERKEKKIHFQKKLKMNLSN